jgi:hypothetical protein
MPTYTLTLVETDDGIKDHGNYKSRRASAVNVAKGLSITNPDGTPIKIGDVVDTHISNDGVSPSIYTWVVSGTQANVTKLQNVFSDFGYVDVIMTTGGHKSHPPYKK